jgi:hypothetical protein
MVRALFFTVFVRTPYHRERERHEQPSEVRAKYRHRRNKNKTIMFHPKLKSCFLFPEWIIQVWKKPHGRIHFSVHVFEQRKHRHELQPFRRQRESSQIATAPPPPSNDYSHNSLTLSISCRVEFRNAPWWIFRINQTLKATQYDSSNKTTVKEGRRNEGEGNRCLAVGTAYSLTVGKTV